MISLIDFFRTKSFLKSTRKTLEQVEYTSFMYTQLKAQEYITEKELEYHKERVFKFIIICGTILIVFGLFNCYFLFF